MDIEAPSPASVELVSQTPSASINKYEIIGKIGRGGYSEVLKVAVKGDRDIANFALKRTRHDTFTGIMSAIDLHEIKALQLLKDETNFLKFIELVKSDEDEFIGLILELCRADLRAILHNHGIKLNVGHIKNMLKQYFTGVAAMHHLRIMHRDIKPANILISNAGIIKIGDFGSSVVIDQQSHLNPNVGTLWYRCPEFLLGCTNYDEKVDQWTLGLLSVEFFTRDPALFKGRNNFEQMKKICKLCGFFSDDAWPEAKETPHYYVFEKLKIHQANTLKKKNA
ncbi:cyclin-dependent kinase 9-like [Nilaparvata lugens]|uniref:cyclin-dependent kinase 9-like n=1 Tax=Nilaparvata lugens TaxID=108931 RepID=UPI00193DBFE2|nr:cyclin-dependent kinase 9-like [Nilaparvata lugens]